MIENMAVSTLFTWCSNCTTKRRRLTLPYYLHTKGTSCYSDSDPYDSRGLAATAAKTWEAGTWEITYLPTTAELEGWQARECARFESAEYVKVPWTADDWYEPYRMIHFCHISVSHPGMVAYTVDVEKGIQDRQIRTTPGRYLEQFAKDLHSDVRAKYIAAVKAETTTYELATTADDIVRVYVNGPSSCMGRSNFDSDSWYHPCRVYGDSDLAVAYLEHSDENDHGVYARCVIWLSHKIYTRLYGDENTLRVLLETDGYTYGNLHGARIRRIDYDRSNRGNYIVMPYIDAADSAELDDDDRFIRLCQHGSIDTKETSGRVSLSERTQTCAHCEEEMPYDEDESYCSSCENERFYCQSCDEDTWGETIEVGGDTICENCARSTRQTCCSCSDHFWHENFSEEEIAERTRYHVTDYCEDCSENLAVCPECGEEITGRDTLACPACGIVLRYHCTLTLPLPFDLATVNETHSATETNYTYVASEEAAF